jgi:hypothetical protein
MKKGLDRRRTPRQRLAAFAALETEGRHANDQAFSAVVDVSRSGIGLRTGQPPLPGQGVILRLAIEEDVHTLRTIATRATKRDAYTFEVGLDWSQCTADDLAFLDTYLAAVDDSRDHIG